MVVIKWKSQGAGDHVGRQRKGEQDQGRTPEVGCATPRKDNSEGALQGSDGEKAYPEQRSVTQVFRRKSDMDQTTDK
jgi:hypothetical protein